MSANPRVKLLPIFGLLLALPLSPRLAHAQTIADSTWAVLDVTGVINRALDESTDSGELREKLVRRFSECSLMYGGLSTLTTNADSKKKYVQAQIATMEVEATIAKPLPNDKRLELETAAQKSVATKLRTVKAHGDKEVAPLLKSCKALNDTKEIRNALQDLPSQ